MVDAVLQLVSSREFALDSKSLPCKPPIPAGRAALLGLSGVLLDSLSARALTPGGAKKLDADVGALPICFLIPFSHAPDDHSRLSASLHREISLASTAFFSHRVSERGSKFC